MKNILISGVIAVLMGTTALSDTSSMNSSVSGMGILENDYVRAGVNGTAGTFGSGGSTRPGLQYDSDGTGTFPADGAQGDYLTPGTPWDGFSVMVDGTNYANNNSSGTTGITGDGNGLTDGTNSFSWTGGVTSVFDVTNTYTLGATSEYVDITSSITMGVGANDVYFSRHIDPDAMPETGDTSATDNVLGYGVIPDTNVAFSEATVSRYALGIYSTDSNVDAGITRWTTEANSYTENSVDSDGSNTNTGDNTIGLTWHWTAASLGDILTANYAYIFGASAFEAADTASTGGAGGGADTSSWGTLEDVGSATDAAEASEEPTVTSTSDPAITYGDWGDWAHDTDLPVLTQTQTTHDSSVALGVQTIDRETTTIVTTPEERSRTSTTSVVDTYSDSSTVTRTTATGTDTETRNNAVSTVTDPGAFVGRMDQVDQMVGLNTHRNLGIGNGLTGSRITHDMGNGYSADSNVVTLGGSLILDNGVIAGAGLNRVNTTLTGEGSSGSIKSTVLSAEASRHINERNVTVSGSINTANNNMNYSRTIGDFSAAGVTSNRDTWGNVTVEKSTGEIRPFAGLTLGKNTVDSFTETGDVQAILSQDKVEDSYRYATLGFNVEKGMLTLDVSRDFGNSEASRVGVGIKRQISDHVLLDADAEKTWSGNNTSTRITAGITFQF
jgi:hypothetical protein